MFGISVLGQNEKMIRAAETALVLLVAFGFSMSYSIYLLMTGRPAHAGSASFASFQLLFQSGTSLLLLFYVLSRRGWTLSNLSVFKSFANEIGTSLLLFAAAYAAYYIVYYLVYYAHWHMAGTLLNFQAKNIDHVRGAFSALFVAMLAVNPFYEELIVRAYLMTESEFLTNSKIFPVILSVAVQVTYHLYQGAAALCFQVPIFLIFAIFYSRTRRIAPVILAHFFFDLLAGIYYSNSPRA